MTKDDTQLVVAISSRALFDFEAENALFVAQGDKAYEAFQLERLDQPANKGIAFELARKLLSFNNGGGMFIQPPDASAHEAERIEMIAMDAVMAEERRLGNTPRGVSTQNVGYDIESLDGEMGHLRFIEVKGRIAAGTTITVTKNEILTALNKPEQFILAVVKVDDDERTSLNYVRQPFRAEPDFAATSVTYRMATLVGEE